MQIVRVIVEITDEQTGRVAMRWEKSAPAGGAAGSGLLGQAFEAVQREEAVGTAEAFAAFLAGALLEKQDVQALLEEES